MADRKKMSQKTRFEVFKRDSFACQYCGNGAPQVVLRVDHIHPVSKGGEDDMMNLITACFACNAGKSNRTLDDDTVLQKQRAQLDELNERREQLDMLLRWRDGLKDLGEQEVDAFAAAWEAGAKGWSLNDTGRDTVRKLIKRFGLKQCLDALDTALSTYLKFDAEGKATQESVDLALYKVGGICRMSALPEAERRLYYIKGILRNRLQYLNERTAMDAMLRSLELGGSVDDIEAEAKSCRSWSRFRDWIWAYNDELSKRDE